MVVPVRLSLSHLVVVVGELQVYATRKIKELKYGSHTYAATVHVEGGAEQLRGHDAAHRANENKFCYRAPVLTCTQCASQACLCPTGCPTRARPPCSPVATC